MSFLLVGQTSRSASAGRLGGLPYDQRRPLDARLIPERGKDILYAVRNEALSNVWNFRVISEESASR
jgi:hypothetical protein